MQSSHVASSEWQWKPQQLGKPIFSLFLNDVIFNNDTNTILVRVHTLMASCRPTCQIIKDYILTPLLVNMSVHWTVSLLTCDLSWVSTDHACITSCSSSGFVQVTRHICWDLKSRKSEVDSECIARLVWLARWVSLRLRSRVSFPCDSIHSVMPEFVVLPDLRSVWEYAEQREGDKQDGATCWTAKNEKEER